jgi:hypothetical protein
MQWLRRLLVLSFSAIFNDIREGIILVFMKPFSISAFAYKFNIDTGLIVFLTTFLKHLLKSGNKTYQIRILVAWK